MAVTIYDVAREAGVGIGTVSRAINNSSQISPETRERVLQVIKRLNYQPHAVAQSLARRRTKTIACIIPFFSSYFYIELLRGIQRKITEHGYDLILYSVDLHHKKETFLRRALQEKRVDGVFLVSMEIEPAFAKKFLDANFPIVLVDSFHPHLDSINVDNVEGAYRATNHLVSLGYRKIGMIDGQLKSLPAKLRLEGFRKALAENGIPFQERYFVACDFLDEADGFNKEAGYAAMQQLLALGEDRPRAVFVSSDIQALGAIEAIREANLRVPQDIAVVGFDDVEISRYVGLTTIHQPIMEMGALAVDRLIEKIEGTASPEFKRRFQTELVVRESCGATMVSR
ncbi:MAG: LacI family transcriptional regulator [Calditrichaeota bacterium]|nr:MAG: LacI family transcriptional regulator [Calditrichota bacterium]